MKLLFGDIHNHCGITYGFGGLQNAINNAKSHLDFCAVTGHAFWPDIPKKTEYTAFLVDFHKNGFAKLVKNYPYYKETIKKANIPNEFTTFYSYEMHSSYFGDHHLVSGDDDVPLVYGDTPSLWFDKLKNLKDTIIVPHHIAYTPNYRGINWNEHSEKLCPIVEVCSKHGVSMSDLHPNDYYHNMGARDERNTVYTGLKLGHKIGFVGSTDHHAGFPGSYGDCLLAVLAENNTRSAIMEAIKSRRTYALTADKIKCDFSVDNNPFGSIINSEKSTHEIKFDVELSDYLDKLIIFKNLKPIKIINGETIDEINNNGRYKIRLECGWGTNKDLFTWDYEIETDGEILDIEKCYRGKSILAPSKDIEADDDCNKIDFKLVYSKNNAKGRMETVKNITPSSPSTSSIVLDIKGDMNTKIDLVCNGKTINTTIGQLLQGSITQPTKDTNSQTFKLHRAVPESQFHISGEIVDEMEKGFYHMEIRERNGSQAYVSPIYIN